MANTKRKIPISCLFMIIIGFCILALNMVSEIGYGSTKYKPTHQYEAIENPNTFDSNCYIDEIYYSPSHNEGVLFGAKLLYEKTGVQFYHLTLDFGQTNCQTKEDASEYINQYIAENIDNAEYALVYVTPDSALYHTDYSDFVDKNGEFFVGSKASEFFSDEALLYLEELFVDNFCDLYEVELYDCFYKFCDATLNYKANKIEQITTTVWGSIIVFAIVITIISYRNYRTRMDETIRVLNTSMDDLEKNKTKPNNKKITKKWKIPSFVIKPVIILVLVVECFFLIFSVMKYYNYNNHDIEAYIEFDTDKEYVAAHRYKAIENPNAFDFECAYQEGKFYRNDEMNKAAKLLYDKTGVQFYSILLEIPETEYDTEEEATVYINEFISTNIENPEYALIYIYNNGKFLENAKLNDTYWDNDLGGYFNTKPVGNREGFIVGEKAAEFFDAEALVYFDDLYSRKELGDYEYNEYAMLYESVYEFCNETLNYDDSRDISGIVYVAIGSVIVMCFVICMLNKQQKKDMARILNAPVKENVLNKYK